MPTVTEASGYLATAQIQPAGGSAIEMNLRDWRLVSGIRLTPDTTSQSGQFPIQVPSYSNVVFSASITRNFASGQAPYTNYGLTAGAVISNIYAFEDQTSRGSLNGPCHTLTSLVIQSVNTTAAIASGAAIPISFTGIVSGPTGSYTPPST